MSGWGLCPMNNMVLLRLRCLQTPDTESEQADHTCDEGKRDHTVNATAEDEQIQ
jgi:hypothetical protein